jgi:hypothetical protein
MTGRQTPPITECGGFPHLMGATSMGGTAAIRKGSVAGSRAALVVAIVAIASPCCNSRTAGYPPLGRVTGIVSRAGQPLAGLTVLFQPVAGGRASVAVTNSAGRYTLRFTEVADGAMVGDHTVTLSVDPDASDARATLRVVEGLGKQYSFTVKPGRNTFDIDTAGD